MASQTQPGALPPAPRDPDDLPGASAIERMLRNVTLIGLAANLVLSLLKFVIGLRFRSQACVADGVHSLSDCVTDIAVLVGVSYWMAPADECHPHGHRRIEALIALFIGTSLAVVTVILAGSAIERMDRGHSMPPGWPALVIALISLVCKEVLYQWTARVGTRLHSPALVANAWHHRSDALSSIPVAVSVIVSRCWPEAYFADHIAAVLVSAMLLKVAWDISWPRLLELADAGADQEARDGILRIAVEQPGVESVHQLRTRRTGPGYAVDLHVLVRPDMCVREGHEVCGKVRRELLATRSDVIDVLVHLEPYEGGDPADTGESGVPASPATRIHRYDGPGSLR